MNSENRFKDTDAENTQASSDIRRSDNWRDFDRDPMVGFSVGTASASVFSSNFGRVWPHRLFELSAATVMAKETSQD